MAEEGKTKKGGKLKWIILIFLILLIGGGAGAWYYFLSGLPGSKNASATASAENKAETVKTAPGQNLKTAVLDSFLVNLADPLGKRYIKVTFEVEMVNPDVEPELGKQKAKIRDSLILLLSSKAYADLASAESKITLKTEVANRLNQILGGPKITRVFLTDMVIQ